MQLFSNLEAVKCGKADGKTCQIWPQNCVRLLVRSPLAATTFNFPVAETKREYEKKAENFQENLWHASKCIDEC